MLRPLRVRKREVRKHLLRMSMMRKKRRRRKRRRKKKSKHCSQKTSDLSTNCASLSICSKPHEICSTFLTELKLPTHCCDKTDFWYRSNDMYG